MRCAFNAGVGCFRGPKRVLRVLLVLLRAGAAEARRPRGDTIGMVYNVVVLMLRVLEWGVKGDV